MKTQADLFVILCALTILLAIVLALSELVLRRRKKMALLLWSDAYWTLLALVSCLVISLVISGYLLLCISAAVRIYLWIQDPATSRTFALFFCVPLAFTAGLVLFGIRLRLRGLYGLTEVSAGLAAAYIQVERASAGSSPNIAFAFAFLTAAIYLVVRGLDNMHQSMKAEKPDIVGRLLIRSNDAATPSRGARHNPAPNDEA